MIEEGDHVFVCKACPSGEVCVLVAYACDRLPTRCPWTGPFAPEWERVY